MSVSETTRPKWTMEQIESKVRELGNWFHNIDLRGVKTAPDHFLGDYPSVKWKGFEAAIPLDLSGRSVLDIGCNGGFYSIEMKRRGADRVLAIDFDEDYLNQARFAAEVNEVEIEFKNVSVYDLHRLEERFDVVLFMGVLYHLRHPLFVLDLLHDYVCKDLLVFQSMQRGSAEAPDLQEDYEFWDEELFENRDFPKMHFIENRYSGDCTNWWIPNRACVEGMLRSSGFEVMEHPELEVYVCKRQQERAHETPLAPDIVSRLGGNS
jgi:tRNA (mo5U34)-methyltransferase